MPFETGHTKQGGRKAGTRNKTTLAVKEKIQQFIDGYTIEEMQEDFKKLEPLEKLKLFTAMIEFVQPKLQRTNAIIEDHTINVTVGGKSYKKR